MDLTWLAGFLASQQSFLFTKISVFVLTLNLFCFSFLTDLFIHLLFELNSLQKTDIISIFRCSDQVNPQTRTFLTFV